MSLVPLEGEIIIHLLRKWVFGDHSEEAHLPTHLFVLFYGPRCRQAPLWWMFYGTFLSTKATNKVLLIFQLRQVPQQCICCVKLFDQDQMLPPSSVRQYVFISQPTVTLESANVTIHMDRKSCGECAGWRVRVRSHRHQLPRSRNRLT